MLRAAPLLLLLLALPLYACQRDGLPISSATGDHDGGQASDLGATCSLAGDTVSCRALAGCFAITCPRSCEPGEDFIQCVREDQPHGAICGGPGGCAPKPPCTSVPTAAACDARPDCHALYTGNKPCNSLDCNNHFDKCLDGESAVCSPPAPFGMCASFLGVCVKGDTYAYDNADGCTLGCVHTSHCVGND